MKKRSILLLFLLCASTACKARQTQVERWRSEILERQVSDKTRLQNATDAELWEDLRARLALEYKQGQRQSRRRRIGLGSSGITGLYMFDVSDLIRDVPDFSAPQIGDLRATGDRGERETGYLRDSSAAFSEDALLEMITGTVLAHDFEERGGSVQIVNGRLIIREPQK